MNSHVDSPALAAAMRIAYHMRRTFPRPPQKVGPDKSTEQEIEAVLKDQMQHVARDAAFLIHSISGELERQRQKIAPSIQRPGPPRQKNR